MQTIRPLAADEGDALLSVLRRDPHNNLFLIGNLLSMGWDDPDLQYWGTFDGDRLTGVLMRYRVNWTLYDAGGADFALMAETLDAHPAGARALTGQYALTGQLLQHVRAYHAREDLRSHFAVLDAVADLPGVGPSRRATEADVPALAVLYAHAEELSRDEANIRRVLEHGRIFSAEEDGIVVSAALTNAETPDMAMIGGVFTPPDQRNRGYATACMAALCRDLLSEGIQPCLFYDNPQAGSIYRRLGFREIGTWRLARLRPQG